MTAGASRPYPGMPVCGDAWLVTHHDGACRIAVIDGLGHGAGAAAAAAAAVDALRGRPDLQPAEALALCDRAVAGTRGAAASIAWLDPAAGRLIYAGLGNVEARLWTDAGERRPVGARGIVGMYRRSVRPMELSLAPQWLFVMYSDGIRDRFSLTEWAFTRPRSPQTIADCILAELALPDRRRHRRRGLPSRRASCTRSPLPVRRPQTASSGHGIASSLLPAQVCHRSWRPLPRRAPGRRASALESSRTVAAQVRGGGPGACWWSGRAKPRPPRRIHGA
ncbi:MAG: SpoIIE family protein phosphatase [Dehalococcoidia bacterium]